MPSLLDILSGIGSTLDTYSGASSVRDLIAGDNPFDQLIDPLNEAKRTTGRQMLEKRGVVDENVDQGWVPDIGDLAGFAADVVLDPTNLVGGGLLARLLGKASSAKKANTAIEAANALSREQRAMGAMPEEIAKLTKIVDETGQPKRMLHGTPHAWEGRPDPSKFDKDALYGSGYYTTDSPEVAGGVVVGGNPDSMRPGGRVPVLLNSGYATGRAFKPEFTIPLAEAKAKIAERLMALERPDIHFGYDAIQKGFFTTPVNNAKRLGIRDPANNLDIGLQRIIENPLAVSPEDWKNTAGVNIDDLITSPAPNVKMHFIDSRNPFDSNRHYPVMDLDDKAPGTILDRYAKGRLEQIADAIDEGDDAFANSLLSVKGSELLNALTNHSAPALKTAGYDAIRHTGGAITGGPSHNVVIALDPSKVYLPYIAKELQDLQQVASPNSLLATLAGYNAASKPQWQSN